MAGVRVSDGATVVTTARDGRYTLLADPLRPFVMVSTPAGHEPARNPAGTMRFYEPITALDEQRVDFALVATPDDAHHTMLLLADPQTKTRDETDMLHTETVPAVLHTLRTLGDAPVFGLTCGDIMYDDLSLFPEYERAVTRMGVPFYQAIGNHDLELAAQDQRSRRRHLLGAYFGPYVLLVRSRRGALRGARQRALARRGLRGLPGTSDSCSGWPPTWPPWSPAPPWW